MQHFEAYVRTLLVQGRGGMRNLNARGEVRNFNELVNIDAVSRTGCTGKFKYEVGVIDISELRGSLLLCDFWFPLPPPPSSKNDKTPNH